MTVRELLEKFDSIYMRSRLKETTRDGYRRNIYHINSVLAEYDVSALTLDDIDALVSHLFSERLNNSSVRYVLRTFSVALNFGIRRKYITTNIISLYDKPRKNRIEYNTLSGEDVTLLLTYLKNENSDIFAPVLLACLYGLRRGECIGVKMNDFISDRLFIHRTAVYKKGDFYTTDCKTEKSNRDILIDNVHLLSLKQYDEQRPKEKDGYLFRDSLGKRMTQNQLQLRFKDVLKNCGLPDIRFHDLRHTYATMMLRSGVNPKIVSSVLGHSDVKVTLDIYSHVDISMQEKCLEVTRNLVKL